MEFARCEPQHGKLWLLPFLISLSTASCFSSSYVKHSARRQSIRKTLLLSRWTTRRYKSAASSKRLATLNCREARLKSSGFAPTGYEYREYKNWRGILEPDR